MPNVEARYFLTALGKEPTNCQVDSNTKIIAELIITAEYPVHEEVNMVEMTIVKAGTNNCVKKFRWEGACALRTGVTYTIDTPIFGPLPIGSYNILTGFIGSPLSRSLGECGVNMKEVTC